ncbi:Zinc finger BED domain-containing protein 4 [Eumeta japonica]|uniref:Zinc finger BED domain-containing protein 4 n=1 Tax=Eumeta variegata TaxID=151549 RepID=A0A4C1V5R9_EUMVA|nr:Zinc finger BED domain-containing protein 4 [Eumeta japonica]
MKPKTSDIWQYFVVIDNDYAKCKTCHKNYSRKGRTTTSLKGHLKSMHKEEYEEFCKMEQQRDTVKVNQVTLAITPLQEIKREMIVEESIEENQMWDTSHARAREMDDLIGEMIALQNLPFHFVEGVGFRRVIQTALPNYQLRGHQFFTDHICEEIYTKMAIKIGQMLKQFLKLSFTMDIWSEPSVNVSLLSLTAYGISEDFTRRQIVLECASVQGSLTGDIVRDHVKRMLLKWNIQDEQLHCFIRDGASNIDGPIHLANIPDASCTVDQLQLCVRSALETREVKNLIEKCKKISHHFNHCQIAQDELTKIQTEQLNQPALRVIQDCVTRHVFIHL